MRSNVNDHAANYLKYDIKEKACPDSLRNSVIGLERKFAVRYNIVQAAY
jgi:hypothetical protein